MSVRWRSLGRHVSWFTGRRWKRHGIGDHPAVWIRVVRHTDPEGRWGDDGRWFVVKAGLWGLIAFVDRRGHYLPHEPNRVRRWITGRIS